MECYLTFLVIRLYITSNIEKLVTNVGWHESEVAWYEWEKKIGMIGIILWISSHLELE